MYSLVHPSSFRLRPKLLKSERRCRRSKRKQQKDGRNVGHGTVIEGKG
jgi:hypothetical protein